MNLFDLKCYQSSELGVGGSNPSARATQNNRFQRGLFNLSALKRDKKRDTVFLLLIALLLLGGCIDEVHNGLDDVKNTRQNTRYKDAGDGQ